MGKRLSKIYTRTGDSGETGLGDGNRIAKDAPRVEAMGDIDELNSQLGVIIEQMKSVTALAKLAEFLRSNQHRIFDLGGEVSIPDYAIIKAEHVAAIETQLDAWNSELPPLDNFILPGGSLIVAHLHLARAVCRRAERRLVQLARIESVNPEGLRYLNRLSDLLFVAARYSARVTGTEEVLWEKG